MIFRQLFDRESCTYTYIVADPETRSAAIIDPVLEMFDRDVQVLGELSLSLKYSIETHVHADHITSAFKLKEELGAEILLGESTGLECADRLLKENEIVDLDSLRIETILTPGHTNGCTCFVVGDRVFTGDTLMIRGCGRTDFQEGSSRTLFASVREKLFSLPDETLVYPGHDYKGRTCSSIGEEKAHNPRLKVDNTLEQFAEIMDNLNLAYPKKIDVAVPANKNCGREA
ncbi:MAG: MBL fold metallo-hydrolase [Pseudomonadota bacterium]